MANFRPIEMRFLDELFGMAGGYVLDFSNRTFAEFFGSEFNTNIDDQIFAQEGGSKGKRLRYFLQHEEKATAIKILKSLWEYRDDFLRRSGAQENVANAAARFNALVGQSSERDNATKAQKAANLSIDAAIIEQLYTELLSLASLLPQPKGFAFEKFLKRLFDAYGLEAREAFRLRGEQIDGSFQFAGNTYLLEAKWQNAPSGVADLHTFQGKLHQKAVWARGLFISNSGFTDEGLGAFGRGKSVVCMDGLDLFESLNRRISFIDVLALKVRHGAETGLPFVRVRDLFPI